MQKIWSSGSRLSFAKNAQLGLPDEVKLNFWRSVGWSKNWGPFIVEDRNSLGFVLWPPIYGNPHVHDFGSRAHCLSQHLSRMLCCPLVWVPESAQGYGVECLHRSISGIEHYLPSKKIRGGHRKSIRNCDTSSS